MTPERWEQLVELFETLVSYPPAERAARLAVACPDDPELHAEVARMLESDANAGTFGESPAFRFTPESHTSPHAVEPSLAPGIRLGRYQIADLVGAGGMGEVYRARDPELGRDVGIKVLTRRGEISGDQLARFAREARAVAALNHSNILTVYDVGVEGGLPYVVAELLEGETLRARLERGPLVLEEAAGIAVQILSGLAAAHDRGIIHRDLKPENLFLTTDGVVKILDFGLAKQTTRAADTERTATGLLMGTAGYMAPEQVRGADADVRSDLFSFGAVLYEMLTGHRAFTGDSAVETMHAVLTSNPAFVEPLPAHMSAVVQRCLAKDPVNRFASAHETSAALKSIAAASDFAGLTSSELRRDFGADRNAERSRALIRYAVAAAVIAAVITASLLLQRRASPPGPGAAGRPALAVMPFDDRSGDPAAAWLSTGIPGMLVTSLAQTPGLDVIGTERLEASFKALGREPLDRSARGTVARHAGAGAVLVGTVFKVGSEFRLEVQVQDVETGRIVIARTEQGADLFGLVDAIGSQVRAALDVANRPAGRPLRDVTTTSLEAYELYAQAQQARHNNRWADARKLFDEALRADPGFTLARAQLASILDRLGENAAAAAERATVRSQLDRLPERQRLLAEAVQTYDSNPSRAIELLERLIDRYPDEEEAYDAVIHAYTHARDPAYWKKALAFMQRWARAIPGPGSGHFHNHYGYAYIEHGLFTEAEREFRAYIRVSPDEANGYDSLAELFVMTGRAAMAVEQYDEALKRNPQFGWSHFGRSYALAMLGRSNDALAGLTTLQNLGASGGMPRAVIHMLQALMHARIGVYGETATHLDAARRLAREQGNAAAEADANLIEAALALDRGDNARAGERASHVLRIVYSDIDIMRARRTAVAHLLVGIADARSRRIAAAQRRLAEQRALDASNDALQVSWQQALLGEIALAERRLDDAETAFRAAEYPIESSFAIYPALVALANNMPFRDGLARTALARGDSKRAMEEYRRLNQPDVTSKWKSVFEPRFALAAADAAARIGEAAVSRAERARFLEVWRGDATHSR